MGLKKEPKSATSVINQSPKAPEQGVRRSSRSTKGINRKYEEPLVKTENMEEEQEDEDNDYVPEITDEEDDLMPDIKIEDEKKPTTKSSPKRKGKKGNF